MNKRRLYNGITRALLLGHNKNTIIMHYYEKDKDNWLKYYGKYAILYHRRFNVVPSFSEFHMYKFKYQKYISANIYVTVQYKILLASHHVWRLMQSFGNNIIEVCEKCSNTARLYRTVPSDTLLWHILNCQFCERSCYKLYLVNNIRQLDIIHTCNNDRITDL